jgi:hypothetical protein
MDFETASLAVERAMEHVRRGTPFAEALRDVATIGLAKMPREVSEGFAGLDLEAGYADLREKVLLLLKSEPPSTRINGLCFGIVELIDGEEDSDGDEGDEDDGDARNTDENGAERTEQVLYLSGSTNFDAEAIDPDWPCDPAWFPEGRYLDSHLFRGFGTLRDTKDFDVAWLVDCCIIEPAAILAAASLAAGPDGPALLGKAKYRGIGTGFDSGDLHTLGVLTAEGFEVLEPSDDEVEGGDGDDDDVEDDEGEEDEDDGKA